MALMMGPEYPRVSIDVARNPVTFNTMGHYERDRSWRFVDEFGHEHSWQSKGSTWRDVTVATWWCDSCRDEHYETVARCLSCEETLSPATTYVSGGTTVIEGLTEVTLVVEDIDGGGLRKRTWVCVTEEEMRRISEAADAEEALRLVPERLPDGVEWLSL